MIYNRDNPDEAIRYLGEVGFFSDRPDFSICIGSMLETIQINREHPYDRPYIAGGLSWPYFMPREEDE